MLNRISFIIDLLIFAKRLIEKFLNKREKYIGKNYTIALKLSA